VKIIKHIILFTGLFFCISATAQLQNLKGKVTASEDVEGIHILNKTALKYTVTNTDGTFEILARANDTLTISSLKYETKELRITEANISNNSLTVFLVDKIIELDEVVVGKILTGNLSSDMANLKVETPINFYDLGIPGYTGKPKTLSERKLYEATTGGGIIPFAPIINAITGRTKMLKKNIQLDNDMRCMRRFKDEYRDVLFYGDEFSEAYQNQFFNFMMLSEDFRTVCTNGSALSKVAFLQKELKTFKKSKPLDDNKN
jgi:hypothetical protein